MHETMEQQGDPGRLWLARHGLTRGNAEGVRLGSLDPPLLPEGREQARALAERVRTLGVEAVWCSPLARARGTAEIVADRLGLPLHVDADLREMALGPWEGLREDEIARRFPEEHRIWQTEPASLRLPGHETFAALETRVARAVERILRAHRPALAVTHLAAMRAAWVHFSGREARAFFEISPGECELLRLDPIRRPAGAPDLR